MALHQHPIGWPLAQHVHDRVLVVIGRIVAVGGAGLQTHVGYAIDTLEVAVVIMPGEDREYLATLFQHLADGFGIAHGVDGIELSIDLLGWIKVLVREHDDGPLAGRQVRLEPIQFGLRHVGVAPFVAGTGGVRNL